MVHHFCSTRCLARFEVEPGRCAGGEEAPSAPAPSRAAVRNVRENLLFASACNAPGVPLEAGALYPVLGVLLSPMVAAAAMSLGSVSVIANALRLGAQEP